MKEASHLSDLWGDRRVSEAKHDGPERRSGIDRRSELNNVDSDQRNQAVSRHRWRSVRRERIALILGDIFSLTVSFVAAWLLTRGAAIPATDSSLFNMQGLGKVWVMQHLVLVLGVAATFWLTGQYGKRRPVWDELSHLFKVIVIAGFINAAMIYFLQIPFPREWLLTTWALSFLLLPLTRFSVKKLVIRLGGWMRPTVIIGIGRNAEETAHSLASDKMLGFQLKAFMAPPSDWYTTADEPDPVSNIKVEERGYPVYRISEQPGKLFERLGKPHIIVAMDGGYDAAKISELLNKSCGSYSTMNIVPSIRGLPLVGTEALHFFRHEVLLLQVQNNLARKMPQRIKRTFDIVVSLSSMILLSPLMAVIAWRIKRHGTSPFFRHRRVGLDGIPFYCYKFQSMVSNADEVLKELLEKDPQARKEWEQTFKLKDDPRVTRIGAFLRRTSLDELPQLWNVLKGEMSLVGPRPIVQPELDHYGHHSDYYLEAKPGITGVWQISGRSDVSYKERVALDVWYAKNWTLWYDIVILVKTVGEVLRSKGAY